MLVTARRENHDTPTENSSFPGKQPQAHLGMYISLHTKKAWPEAWFAERTSQCNQTCKSACPVLAKVNPAGEESRLSPAATLEPEGNS